MSGAKNSGGLAIGTEWREIYLAAKLRTGEADSSSPTKKAIGLKRHPIQSKGKIPELRNQPCCDNKQPANWLRDENIGYMGRATAEAE